MGIRWRFSVFVLQLITVGVITFQVTGAPWSSSIWFAALLAYAANGQLVEPFFSRPVDVLANGVLALVLFFLAEKTVARPGWNVLAGVIVIALIASAVASVAGAGREEGRLVPLGRASRVVSGVFTAKALYSALFWLGLIEAFRGVRDEFWLVAIAWVGIVLLGAVNWQAMWLVVRRREAPVAPVGLLGPSKLLVAGPDIPRRGTRVELAAGSVEAPGTILARVRRLSDVWGEVLVEDETAVEKLIASSAVTIRSLPGAHSGVLGIVDAGSTQDQLVFTPTRPLRIGGVVAVGGRDGDVLYQVVRAEVVDARVRGGGSLDVSARAVQIGLVDRSAARIVRHRWVPNPGAPVREPPDASIEARGRLLLGHVLGTAIPVYVDCDVLKEGHMAVLGMTRMGKTTFARRLTDRLGGDCRVVVLDQTGEYRTKAGLPSYDSASHSATAGVAVAEPPAAKAVPDFGLEQLRDLANEGFEEYKTGAPFRRVLVVDEAHQFVPEPAGMGFGAPGRESAIQFGMYVMQVRKYGLTLVLISQRTAVVAKSALSQCENVVAFKSVDQTGLDYLEAAAGSGARDVLPTLGVGEALVCGPAISTDSSVGVKLVTP